MKLLEIYKILILWVGVFGLVFSLDEGNWLAFSAFTLLVFTAIFFKDAKNETES